MNAAEQETVTVSEPWQTAELDDATIKKLRELLFPQHADRQPARKD